MPTDKQIRRVATVGTGAIGSSWTALFLARGFDVMATDPAPNAESSLRRYVDTVWGALVALGVSPKGSPEHLCFSADLRGTVAEVDFIQESGPDREDLKVRLLAEIDAAAPAESIIASSSADVTMSVMQSACTRPERCVIGHPFDPPHLMPLVEVVGGALTSQHAIDRAVAFYASLGKKPILLRKELAGHVSNRLQAALYRELAHLIDGGVLSVADADDAVTWGPALRWAVLGPSLHCHLAGGAGGIRQFIERNAEPMAAQWKALGDPQLTAQLQQAIVDGVLDEVGDRKAEALAEERDAMLVALLGLRTRRRKARGSGARLRRSVKGH